MITVFWWSKARMSQRPFVRVLVEQRAEVTAALHTGGARLVTLPDFLI